MKNYYNNREQPVLSAEEYDHSNKDDDDDDDDNDISTSTSQNVIAMFVNGFEDLWDIIFSFIGGTPWRDHYLSLLLVSRQFKSVLQHNDEFNFFHFRAYVRRKTAIRPVSLPSLSYLASNRGKYLCKYFSSAIDHVIIRDLLLSHKRQAQQVPEESEAYTASSFNEEDSDCTLQIIKELLKYYQWRIEGMKQLTICEDLMELAVKCERVISLLTMHKEIDKLYYDELIMLLSECSDYCTSANLYGESIANCCEHLIKSNSQYRDEKSLVLAAVQNDGCALAFASDRLKNDKDVVLAAVGNYGYTLKYASDRVKGDKDVVLLAVQSYGYILQYASQDVKADRKIVLAAVNNNGYALEYAAPHLRADYEVVMTAVKRYGHALKYASDDLRNNPKIVAAAVQNNRLALRYASRQRQDEILLDLGTCYLDYTLGGPSNA